MRKDSQKRPFAQKSTWMMLPLIWGAFALYLYQLDGQSFWRDEILSIARANQSVAQIFSNINIVTGVEAPDLHPPFYFLLLSLWKVILGESEFTYRFVSVLMGILALPLFYVCGTRVWGRASGVWTAVFASLSSFYFWYAQETRMYATLLVATLLVIYTLWPLLFPSPRKRDVFYFGGALFLALYIHYTAVFLLAFSLAAIVFAQLIHSKYRLRLSRRLLIVVGVGAVLLVLVAIPLWSNLSTLLTARGFIAFGRPTLLWLAQSGFNTFTQGSTNPPAIPLWQMIPFLSLAVVGAFSFGSKSQLQAILLTTGGFFGVLLLFYVAAFIQANYSNPRHLMILSPFLFLLIGHGMVTISRQSKLVGVFVGGAALLLSGVSLYQTVTAPPVIRDDVRALAAFIEERAQPEDRVLWHNAVMSMAYDYYEGERETAVLPRYGQNDVPQILTELDAFAEGSERIWFVRHPSPPFFDSTALYDVLQESKVSTDGASFDASWAILSVELMQDVQRVDALPADALPIQLEQAQYALEGIIIDPVTTVAGGTWTTLYWQLNGEPDEIPPKVCLQLLQTDGLVWSDGCTFLQLPNASNVNEGQLLAHDVWLDVPEGLAPMPYQLSVVLGNVVEEIGTLTPERPLSSITQQPIIEYENGLNLVDVHWLDEKFQAGFWVLGDLVWQIGAHPLGDVQMKARLIDPLGRVVTEEVMAINSSNLPEAEWQQGDLMRTRLALPIPYRTNGRYRLQIALQDEAQSTIKTAQWPWGKTWSTLGNVQIEDWPLETELPADHIVLDDQVLFGEEAIELAGYKMIREEEKLHITLSWRNLKELDENYGTFVHLGQVGVAPLAQAGGPDWERPTQSWRTDEIVSQTFMIELPTDELDDTVVVQVGLYSVDNPDVRLPVTINGVTNPDHIYLLSSVP